MQCRPKIRHNGLAQQKRNYLLMKGGGAKNYAQRLGYDFVGGKKHMYLFHFCCFLNLNRVKQKDAEDFIERNLIPLAEIKSNCITSAYK